MLKKRDPAWSMLELHFILLFILLSPLLARAAPVIRIADGDTLTVLEGRTQVKIRLANIDAPERKQAFGTRSRQSLAALCFRKDATYAVQNKDRYGRTVAVVTCNGVNVNRRQVETGMAWVYSRYNKDQSLPTVQASAKAARRGLWADAAPVPPWQYRHAPKVATSSDLTCHVGPRGGHYRIVNGHKRYGC